MSRKTAGFYIGGRQMADLTEKVVKIKVIGVGGGEKKVRSILGALNGHYLHALITDVQTAEKVLELADDNTL